MASIRPTAVAGTFYPEDADTLRKLIAGFLDTVKSAENNLDARSAYIVPHAGYVYSGQVAASSYAKMLNSRFEKFLIFGPSHHFYFSGLAVPSVDACATPLGNIAIDRELRSLLIEECLVHVDDEAHSEEHSLEVQFPFIKHIEDKATILPIAIGEDTDGEVEEVLKLVWDMPNIGIIFSTDLSHFHDYDSATELDAATIEAISKYDPKIDGECACGFQGLLGLMSFAKSRELEFQKLQYANSGDVSGERDSVVGYLAATVSEKTKSK